MRWILTVVAALGWVWIAGLVIAAAFGADVRRHHVEAAGLVFGAALLASAWVHGRAATRSIPARPAAQVGTRHLAEPARHAPLLSIVPALAAVLAFGWSLGLGPLSDDFVLRAWAETRTWAPENWPYFRPLPLALWWSLLTAGGDWTVLHLVNVLLHALNSTLVAAIAGRWLGLQAGLVAGTLFALFPASGEAVAWTAGIFDVLATSCVLIAVAAWTSARQSRRATALLLLACALGPLAKETAVVTPALLLAAAFAEPRPWAWLRQRAVSLSIAAGLSASVLAVRLVASPTLAAHVQNVPSSRYEWKELFVRPFAALGRPLRTDMGIGDDVFVAALALLTLLAILIVRLPARRPIAAVLGVGLAWVLIAAAPLLLDFYVSPALEGSRYLYLPSVGFVLVLSAACARTGRAGWLDGTAAVSLVLLLGVWSLRLQEERTIWLAAASTRDALLAQANTAARQVPCRSIVVHNAPDNLRGVYVFREGLPEALAEVPLTPGGAACAFRWTGSTLAALGDTLPP